MLKRILILLIGIVELQPSKNVNHFRKVAEAVLDLSTIWKHILKIYVVKEKFNYSKRVLLRKITCFSALRSLLDLSSCKGVF